MKIDQSLANAIVPSRRALLGEPGAGVSFTALMAASGGAEKDFSFAEIGVMGLDRSHAAPSAIPIRDAASQEAPQSERPALAAASNSMALGTAISPGPRADETLPITGAPVQKDLPPNRLAMEVILPLMQTARNPSAAPNLGLSIQHAILRSLNVRSPQTPAARPVRYVIRHPPQVSVVAGQPDAIGRVAVAVRDLDAPDVAAVRRSIESVLAEFGLSLGEISLNGEGPDPPQLGKVKHGGRPR